MEIELARQIKDIADLHDGLQQYAIKHFGLALEVFPKQLAENIGLDVMNLSIRLLLIEEILLIYFKYYM